MRPSAVASSMGAPRTRIFPPALVTQNDESPAERTNSAAGGGGGGADAPSPRQAGLVAGAARQVRRDRRNIERMRGKYTAAPSRPDGAKGATAASADTLVLSIPITPDPPVLHRRPPIALALAPLLAFT